MPWDPNLGSRPSYLSSPNFTDLRAQIEKLIHKLMFFWNICVHAYSFFVFFRTSFTLPCDTPIFLSPISSICRHLIKPVLQQIRLLPVAWITTSDWLKLRGSHKYTQQRPTCCKTGLPWAGKSCSLYRFSSRWGTTLYFLQQVFATCNGSMKCIDYRFSSLSSLFLVAYSRIRFRAWKAVESWASCKENCRYSERVTVKRFVWGKKGGAVLRALASHQCSLGWVCCWFSSLLREVFSPGTTVFHSP